MTLKAEIEPVPVGQACFLTPFLGPQKVETSYHPKGPKQEHRHPQLYQSSHETRGLGSVHRFVGRLLSHPHQAQVSAGS